MDGLGLSEQSGYADHLSAHKGVTVSYTRRADSKESEKQARVKLKCKPEARNRGASRDYLL